MNLNSLRLRDRGDTLLMGAIGPRPPFGLICFHMLPVAPPHGKLMGD